MDFGVRTTDLSRQISRVEGVSGSVKECASRVLNVSEGLSSIGLGELQGNVVALSEKLNKHSNVANQLYDSLARIVVMYINTDGEIASGKLGRSADASFVGGKSSGSVGENAIRDGKDDEDKRDEFIDNFDYQYNAESSVVAHINVSPEFLNKDYCLALAKRMIEEHGVDGLIDGMDAERIAAEIYGHTIGYYMGYGMNTILLGKLEGCGIIGLDQIGQLANSFEYSGVVADINANDPYAQEYLQMWNVPEWIMKGLVGPGVIAAEIHGPEDGKGPTHSWVD